MTEDNTGTALTGMLTMKASTLQMPLTLLHMQAPSIPTLWSASLVATDPSAARSLEPC